MRLGSIILIVCALGICSTHAQIVPMDTIDASEVSPAVRAMFDSLFTPSTSVEWYKAGGFVFEAHFAVKNQFQIAGFRSDGKLLFRKYKIAWNSVPNKFQRKLSQEFAGYRKNRALIETTLDGTPMSYLFYLENEEETRIVRMQMK